jgi:hypothetical protein
MSCRVQSSAAAKPGRRIPNTATADRKRRERVSDFQTMSFTAHSKDDALSQYTQLFSSPNPNDKLLALAGLIQFTSSADLSFLQRCAEHTDYLFLDKMIRNGRPDTGRG